MYCDMRRPTCVYVCVYKNTNMCVHVGAHVCTCMYKLTPTYALTPKHDSLAHAQMVLIKHSSRPGRVAHTCNPGTLEG